MWGRGLGLWAAVWVGGCAARGPVALTPLAEAPRGPAPVVTEALPYDAPHVHLAGVVKELDLESLSSRATVFKLDADVSGLSGGDRSVIERHLAADPRWRVCEDDGVLVAYRREQGGDAWWVAAHGLHTGPEGAWRAGLRLQRWPTGSEWGGSPLVATVPAGRGPVKVTGFTVEEGPGHGRVGSALTVEGSAVSFDVFEATDEAGRPRTSDLLSRVPALVKGIDAGQVRADGYTRTQIPADEPHHGEVPELWLWSPAPGTLEVRGRANPARPGWTWVRVLDADGQPWDEAALSAGSRERIGWSSDDALFYLQGRFPVASGAAFPGTAELWFQPDKGAPERLGAWSVKVPKR